MEKYLEDTLFDLFESYENYEDIIDSLRSLNSLGEITDDELQDFVAIQEQLEKISINFSGASINLFVIKTTYNQQFFAGS